MRKILPVLAIFALACTGRQTVAERPNHCSTEADVAICHGDPKNCVCDAYGDCGMANCIARGEAVARERETPAPSPPPPSPPPPVIATGGPRSCRDAADHQQCSEESYFCPCEAYGDCGQDYCKEPAVKPREAERSCRNEGERALCRENPSNCPCQAHGLCGMPECSLTLSAPIVSSPPPPAVVAPPSAKHPCSTPSERAGCATDPWGCPCEAYGDCGMASCKG